MNILDKFHLDLLVPNKILGVTVTTNNFQYKLSDLPYVQYLDLANLKVITGKIKEDEYHDLFSLEFDREFFQTLIESELNELQRNISQFLFTTYEKIFFSDTQFASIIKYLNVFNALHMYERDVISKNIGQRLLKLRRHFNPPLVRAIFKSVFLNSSAVNALIYEPSFASFIDYMLSTSDSSLCALFSDTFKNQNVCPILGSLFCKREVTLKKLLNLGIKKEEFRCAFLPFHSLLMEIPLYAGFSPISDYGNVSLNRKTADVRDHLIFEFVYIICLHQNFLSDIEIMKDCIRLIYRTISEPYISTTEMFRRLQLRVPSMSLRDITETVETYRSILPQVPEITVPRTLLHLCRCSIRNFLFGKIKMEEGIDRLGLPSNLTDFLNLKEEMADNPARLLENQ